jgi:hypothetical protein
MPPDVTHDLRSIIAYNPAINNLAMEVAGGGENVTVATQGGHVLVSGILNTVCGLWNVGEPALMWGCASTCLVQTAQTLRHCISFTSGSASRRAAADAWTRLLVCFFIRIPAAPVIHPIQVLLLRSQMPSLSPELPSPLPMPTSAKQTLLAALGQVQGQRGPLDPSSCV